MARGILYWTATLAEPRMITVFTTLARRAIKERKEHEKDLPDISAGTRPRLGDHRGPSTNLADKAAARDRARRSRQHNRHCSARGVRVAGSAARADNHRGEPYRR